MSEITSNFIHDIIDADLAENPDIKIITRFPPEPNGYLHIGSAKAIMINYETAKNMAVSSIFVTMTQTPQKRTTNTLNQFMRTFIGSVQFQAVVSTTAPTILISATNSLLSSSRTERHTFATLLQKK